jgi:hypothetical protein
MNRFQLLAAALAVTLAATLPGAGAAAPLATADRPNPPGGKLRSPPKPPPARPVPPHLDQRYRHDHYYPPHGQVLPAPPHGSISIAFGRSHYFFHAGVWFMPVSGRYVVVAPPVGIVVPLLPPAHVTLWIGSVPYYYANGVYYAAATAGPGYVVVAPPPGAQAAEPGPRVPPEPVIYPRDGQDAAQTDADREECGDWAAEQRGAESDPDVWRRAFEACMDGRGYTVR